MSPVVRKWGIRAVAGLFCTAILVCATLLVVAAYAGATQAMDSAISSVSPVAQLPGGDDSSWWNVLDRYGLPMLILALLGFYGKKATVAAWEYFKPIGERIGGSAADAFEKISSFADRADGMLQKSAEVDRNNSIKIGETYEMVSQIHGHIVK